jgi:hypothetical protein
MRAWIRDDADEPDYENVINPSTYLDVVAAQFASTKHADADYPDEMVVCVRDDIVDGVRKLHTFVVYATPSVSFSAAEMKDEP